jgi:TonB family protein
MLRAMNCQRTEVILIFLGLALTLGSSADSAKAQDKKTNCGQPPKILSSPRFSREDLAKWKGKSVGGKVAILVSEQGNVTQAQVLAASPKEAAESLLTAAKQAKFEPRPGCGELKTEVVVSKNQ